MSDTEPTEADEVTEDALDEGEPTEEHDTLAEAEAEADDEAT
jgi:hypothetical protein